jgi:hypothetical protein
MIIDIISSGTHSRSLQPRGIEQTVLELICIQRGLEINT